MADEDQTTLVSEGDVAPEGTPEPGDTLDAAEPDQGQAPDQAGGVQNVPTYSQEDAEEARTFGWKSPQEWQGARPDGYISDPKEYMERVKRFPVFRAMTARYEELARGLEAVNRDALERQRRAHEAELARVRAERDAAAELGDMDAYRQRVADEDRLAKGAPQAAKASPEWSDDDRAAFDAETWLKNPLLLQEATTAVDYAMNTGQISRTSSPREQIAYVKSQMAMKYPHLFQSDAPKAAPAKAPQKTVGRVDGGGLGTAASGQDLFASLPAEATAAFKRFVADGLYKDTPEERKNYANAYHGS